MKSLIVSICILGLVGLITGITSWAATTGTVTATVTARNSSITISTDGSIAYGTVDLSGSTSTDVGVGGIGTVDPETFQNTGSVAQFNIKTSGGTGGTAWTPGATAGSDIFVHSFTTTTIPIESWQALETVDTYETASSTVDASVSQTFYMKIDMPTASTDYVQKSITVTVQAVAN